jgi:hypothetical protein
VSQTLSTVPGEDAPEIPRESTQPTIRYSPGHLGGLRRFAIAITVLTILGHTFLGFEQSYAQPLVSLASAYGTQLLLEGLSAWSERRRPRFLGGPAALLNFLLSAHITGLAIPMLLYFNERLWVVAFAAAVAIGSKTVFRAPYGSGTRHFLNPSNFGISVTLLLFPWVGLAMPWQFGEGLTGIGDWLLIAVILVLGTTINFRYTRRIFVVLGFLGGFVAQALFRSVFLDAPLLAVIMPATGVTAWIFTFYMVPDPATTPTRPVRQMLFGASVAGVYLVLMMLHIVFGLFYALTIVTLARGVGLYVEAFLARLRSMPQPEPVLP